jgi:hypothetical protein
MAVASIALSIAGRTAQTGKYQNVPSAIKKHEYEKMIDAIVVLVNAMEFILPK